MNEILYIVEIIDNGSKVSVIATLTREDDHYIFTPYNLNPNSVSRFYPKVVIKSKGMPAMAERRLYSKNRPDIKEILARYGLQSYDKWELLKRTRGRLLTDNIQYLTKEELEILKESKNIFPLSVLRI
ncbi:hypothetical protein M4D70_25290 [Brevibacillus borstelensis]|uniref:hypothetical protein n=1 Tax=Brevibacillus borstelensis TaxID=45462 RepID=UPI00203E0B51|nr:hypothetical protein [Brevibacillus borstelensis]MCM3625495.1 hypothetical protein [Brevibacillus borstelensis]